jgi:hypothetical protein
MKIQNEIEYLPYLKGKPNFSGSGIWSFQGKYFRVIVWDGAEQGHNVTYTEIELSIGDRLSIWINGNYKIKSEKTIWKIIAQRGLTEKLIKIISKNTFDNGEAAMKRKLKNLLGIE